MIDFSQTVQYSSSSVSRQGECHEILHNVDNGHVAQYSSCGLCGDGVVVVVDYADTAITITYYKMDTFGKL